MRGLVQSVSLDAFLEVKAHVGTITDVVAYVHLRGAEECGASLFSLIGSKQQLREIGRAIQVYFEGEAHEGESAAHVPGRQPVAAV
jgi:hypothetical protein